MESLIPILANADVMPAGKDLTVWQKIVRLKIAVMDIRIWLLVNAVVILDGKVRIVVLVIARLAIVAMVIKIWTHVSADVMLAGKDQIVVLVIVHINIAVVVAKIQIHVNVIAVPSHAPPAKVRWVLVANAIAFLDSKDRVAVKRSARLSIVELELSIEILVSVSARLVILVISVKLKIRLLLVPIHLAKMANAWPIPIADANAIMVGRALIVVFRILNYYAHQHHVIMARWNIHVNASVLTASLDMDVPAVIVARPDLMAVLFRANGVRLMRIANVIVGRPILDRPVVRVIVPASRVLTAPMIVSATVFANPDFREPIVLSEIVPALVANLAGSIRQLVSVFAIQVILDNLALF
jgi:hypothetical protein